MNLSRLVLVIVGTGIVTSLTDWFFAGDWLHRRFTYPGVWRTGAESRAIALTSPLPFLTCGVFAWLLAWLGFLSLSGTIKMAVAIWIIGPLPLILTNAAFIKLHSIFTIAYATGWLVKLLIVALAVAFFLR